MTPSLPSNHEIAVFAVASLGGAQKRVNTEEIAVFCHKLAPSQFSWSLKEYREKGWPDKFVVKCALEDAKKKKHGSLVSGNCARDASKDGWRLTALGAEWLKEHSDRFSGALHSPIKKQTRTDLRLIRKITGQKLFQIFLKQGSCAGCSRYDFTDMLNCSPDAPTEVLRAKFDRLLASATEADEKKILLFLNDCAREFNSIL
ncbi:hypothetical protein ACFL2T_00550 [Elusimicrobiota bacterium]